MKNKILIFILILLIAVVSIFMLFSKDKKILSISFKDHEIKLNIRESKYLETINNDNIEVGYTSNNPNVVLIDNNGKVTGIKEGSAIVRVYLLENEEVFDEAKIEVIDNNERLKLSTNEVTMKVNDVITLKVNTNKEVNWYTNNNNIVTVSNGVITAINGGHAIVIARTNDGQTDSCSVTVTKLDDNITINYYEIEYDGNNHEAKVDVLSNNKYEIDYYKDNSCNNKISNYPKEVGTYYIKVKTSGNNKYNEFTSTCEKAIEIKTKKIDVKDASELYNLIDKNGINKMQIVVFSNGNIVSTKNYNASDNESFYISSASKTILGIIASLMVDDGTISLDKKIEDYWHKLYYVDYNTCTKEWRSYLNNVDTVKKYTAPNKYLVENHPALKHLLTHSSTIYNLNMVHMNPKDPSSEYFGGGMSRTYDRAAFMLGHTSHQLFEKGKTPGVTTNYNYLNDRITREHALAGFTLQISIKKSLNEYLREKLSFLKLESNYGFVNGNSIYFATSYRSSAKDLAKIISIIANKGKYNDKQVFSNNMISNLKHNYTNLANQTIAFNYNNGKYFKFGSYKYIENADGYGISDIVDNYVSFISFDDKTSKGYVLNIKFNSKNVKNKAINIFNKLQSNFYN